MGKPPRITPDQRNRALRRTRLLTSTVAGGSVAAVLGLSYVAALSYSGKSTAATAPATTPTPTPTTAATPTPSSSVAATAAPTPAPTPTPTAHATSGGS